MGAEFVGILIGAGIVAGFTYAGYWVGREAAQREAAYTVSTQRQTIKGLERQRDDARGELTEIRRNLKHLQIPDAEVPRWMR